MPTEGVWAYAVVGGEDAGPRIAGLHGVAGEPVRVVWHADIAAVVGTVGLDQFGEDALRRNLEDLDWLAATARAHDAVISAIARFGPVVPMRMATVYLDDTRVAHLLQTRRDDFAAALRHVTGRAELGVKAYADPEIVAGAQESVPAGEKLSGTAYLMRRRRALTAREDAFRVASQHAERIHAELLAHAVDGKRKPASDRALSGRSDWTVLNGTYLVNVDDIDSFTEVADALDRDIPGIDVEVTGPWPPYSFAGDVVTQD
ncbi:gas vesicle protein GvpFL [Mycolicibacterium agri]|uniref:Gas vesicle protein n=1 Tax=Mycolicibacterium agri TaxID=36811 RepID=A0A2A7N5C3_MYCAG|nr:GvpL/GvpF family gas vesicle protein [Mycolicibacterium agri]PEG38963.1 gas vesicle protein GvpFL [Mycolicibacterium agri]GFG53265.1 gas vesicle protein [Mycolicibacterium agri]